MIFRRESYKNYHTFLYYFQTICNKCLNLILFLFIPGLWLKPWTENKRITSHDNKYTEFQDSYI